MVRLVPTATLTGLTTREVASKASMAVALRCTESSDKLNMPAVADVDTMFPLESADPATILSPAVTDDSSLILPVCLFS